MLYKILTNKIGPCLFEMILLNDKDIVSKIEYFVYLPNCVTINYLFTEVNYRNKGIGKFMIHIMECLFDNPVIDLNVNPFGDDHLSFQDTCKFYKKCGFRMSDEFNMIKP